MPQLLQKTPAILTKIKEYTPPLIIQLPLTFSSIVAPVRQISTLRAAVRAPEPQYGKGSQN